MIKKKKSLLFCKKRQLNAKMVNNNAAISHRLETCDKFTDGSVFKVKI